jgi:hypothetical protein
MRKLLNLFSLVFIATALLNISVAASTVLLHESGHYLMGLLTECKNVRFVLIDQNLGTYTEMNCPHEQPAYFPIIGAFLLTLPYALLFFLLDKLPEKNLFFIVLGFNLLISASDLPPVQILQYLSLTAGGILVSIGEFLFIDKLLLFVTKVEI